MTWVLTSKVLLFSLLFLQVSPVFALRSETLRTQSGSPIVQSGVEDRLRGTPVSHQEAGVTEQQYLAELRVYLDSLATEPLPAEGAGPLSQEGVRHVVFFYPYTLYAGGAPTFQRNILETLLKTHRNLTLDLIYLNFDEAPSMWHLNDPLRNNQITLHGIPNRNPGGAEVAKPALAERLKQAIHKIHGESPIDLIVNNNSTHLYEMSRGLLEFAHGQGIPTHLYFHGGLITEGLRYLMQHSDGVATNSSAFGQIFSQLGVNAEVLPPLSDLSFFWSPLTDSDRAAMDPWIEQYGFKGKKVIVHPARLYPLKGQEDVILAAEVLQNRYPKLADQITWVILGPPRDVGEGERLRRLAQQKGVDVLFFGMQTREEMRRWYHLAYAVVYPTRGDEPFGLVAAEAQAAGTPVVVTNVGGLPETLLEGQTGLVVGRQDPEHLAEAIAYLVVDTARRHQMAQAAYRYTQERYPPQRTLAGFTDSYLRAVRSKKEGKQDSRPLGNPPLDPGRVLFDLYNPRRDSRWRGGRVDVSKVDQWRRAWLAKINQAQPHWKPNSQLPFDYSEEATPTYDPNRIPTRPLGPFQRLQMPENPNRSRRGITRQSSLLHSGESHLLDLWESRFLLDDPFSDELVVTANRYPKVIYDSLLLSRQWQPQRLTPQAIHSQIEWARRGVISEFHHPDVFVDHLHLHLLVSDTAPVARFSGSFVLEDQWGGVAVGGMGYPVRHIALASSDFNALKNATFLLAEQLEEEDRPFSQTVLPAPQGDSVIVLFHVWKDFPKSFSFSPVGFVKVAQEEVPDSSILEEMGRIFLSAKDLMQLRASFWDRWTDTETTVQAGAEESIFDWEAAGELGIGAVVMQDIGFRPTQQDDYALVSIGKAGGQKPAGVLAVLADGMGGLTAGDLASRMAVVRIPEILRGSDAADLLRQHEASADAKQRRDLEDKIQERIREAVSQAHGEIRELGDWVEGYRDAAKEPAKREKFKGLIEELAGRFGKVFDFEDPKIKDGRGGTTVVVALVTPGGAFIASAGDSRIYLYGRGGLSRQTRDDASYGNLSQYLGMDGEIELQQRVIPLRPGDRLLLATDGLTNAVSDNTLEQALDSDPTAAGAAGKLMEAAEIAQGRDNRTLILLDAPPRGSPTPSPAALSASEQAIARLIFELGLDKTPEPGMAVVSYEAAQRYPQLKPFAGRPPVRMGNGWLLVLSQQTGTKALRELLEPALKDQLRRVRIWEYSNLSSDRSLGLFNFWVRNEGLQLAGEPEPVWGRSFQSLLAGILAALRGVLPGEIKPADAQGMEELLALFV